MLNSHFAPKAKRVIFLHMAGAPSQLELFDYKSELHKLDGKHCTPSLLEGKNYPFLNDRPKLMGPQSSFRISGESGALLSEFIPHFGEVVDEVPLLKAMHTDEFIHAPVQFFLHTGLPRPSRPSMGSWTVYGLGSENQNLP